MYVVSVFGRFCGLCVNVSKTHVLLTSGTNWPSADIAGFQVRHLVQHLGVQLGHVTLTHKCS